MRVLAPFTPSAMPLHAVSPGDRRAPRKVAAFVDFLAERYAADPYLKLR